VTLVAALYVGPRSIYKTLLGPEMCWDEARDARTYAGPWPVICHPPCGPWGAWAHLCTKQDAGAFAVALGMVQRWGGVIEHPAHSRAFDVYDLNAVVEVDQCDFGFRARKKTWLYVSPPDLLLPPMPLKRKPTHTLVNRKYNPGLPGLTSRARSITPPEFAKWLISLAAQVKR
jgi:hypothetical protein